MLAVLGRTPRTFDIPALTRKAIAIEGAFRFLIAPMTKLARGFLLPLGIGRGGGVAEYRRLAAGTGHG